MRRKALSTALPALILVGSLLVGVVLVEANWFSGQEIPNTSKSAYQISAFGVTSSQQEAARTTTTVTTTISRAPANSSSSHSTSYGNATTVTVVSTTTVTLSEATATVTTTKTVTTTVTVTESFTTLTSQSGAIAVTGASMQASDFSTAPGNTKFACSTSPARGSAYAVITNYLAASTTVTSFDIVWAGQSNEFYPLGVCAITAAGSPQAVIYLNLFSPSTLGSPAIPGQAFQGYVTFSNGLEISFASTWQ